MHTATGKSFSIAFALACILQQQIPSWTAFTNAYMPPLNRDALAGVWRLSERKSIFPSFINDSQKQQQQMENKVAASNNAACPLKEFTVFSNKHHRVIAATVYKDKKTSSQETLRLNKEQNDGISSQTWYEHSDVFLKLCSDGSFEQYSSFDDINLDDEEEEDDDDIEEDDDDKNDPMDLTENFLKDISAGVNAADVLKGLSAKMDYSKYTEYKPPTASDIKEKNKPKGNDAYVIKGKWDFQDGKLILATDRPPNTDPRQVHDTILVGKVTVSELIDESEALNEKNTTMQASNAGTDPFKSRLLSVPEGKVKIGKYFYPMNHPSFFERPIYDPTKAGSFELRQVLGETDPNKGNEYDGGWWTSRDYTEELGEKFKKDQLMNRTYFLTSQPIGFQKKNKPRWSRSVKAFVVDKAPINDDDRIRGINVMEMQLFANNTFSTTAGLGSSTILRGKWAIVGSARNYLWFQVWRFGFGRSVSGSTFSEGKYLTKDDEKSYWGKIEEVQLTDGSENEEGEEITRRTRLEIKGTIFFGWGLEPEPVGRFTMVEKITDDYSDEESNDDDGDDDENELFDLSSAGAFQ